MLTSGSGTVQKAVAAAQNSKLGTGGSKHRHLSAGEWVDHGHHALMRISAFKAVGGYDETFSHNEDAEFDYRLRKAGYRIWMSGKTQMVYYPRSSLAGLYFQYLGYGRGRAKNVLKHRMMPKVRQMVPLLVFPVVLLAPFSLVHLAGGDAVPGMGDRSARLWRRDRHQPAQSGQLALAGISAMVMHFGWSDRLLAAAARTAIAAQQGGIMGAAAKKPQRRHLRLHVPAAGACRHASLGRRPGPCRRDSTSASSSPTMTTRRRPSRWWRRWRRTLKLPVSYRHAPARNISIARNACLDASVADFVAFIDDDETASPQMARRTGRDGGGLSGAAAVLGPVRARYRLGCARTGCAKAIFTRPCPSGCTAKSAPATPATSCSGRAPTAFAAGASAWRVARPAARTPNSSITWSRPAAASPFRRRPWVDEVVPRARAAFDWLRRRRFRFGQTHGHLLGRDAHGLALVRQVGLASAKAVYCFASAIPVGDQPVRRNRSVLRGIMHVGVVSGLVGVREIRQYGLPSPQEGGKRAA